MLAWGPFTFSVPTFSPDKIGRQSSGRIGYNEVHGARPIPHKLGPGSPAFSIETTFHPLHLNRAGIPMLRGLHAAAEAQIVFGLMHITGVGSLILSGLDLGEWILKDLDDGQSMQSPTGVFQTITVKLSFEPDGGFGGGAIF